MEDGSGPDGLAKRDGAKALSGAESGDTATTPLDKPSRTKNLITEYLVPTVEERQHDPESVTVEHEEGATQRENQAKAIHQA